jgi:hypothetical protein
VKGKLVHATLGESPQFEAVSYVWGNPSLTKAIVVDGIEVEVHENLWSALWHIREYDKLNKLWWRGLCGSCTLYQPEGYSGEKSTD